MKKLCLLFLVISLGFTIGYAQVAQKPGTLEKTKLNDHFYKLTSINPAGGPDSIILVFTGKDGLLLVDAGWQSTAEKLKAMLKTLGNGKVKYVVITHNHADHYGGSRIFGKETIVISHPNAVSEMKGEYFALKATNTNGITTIGVSDNLTLYFNDEKIEIIAMPGGHTNTDLIVHFTKSKIAALGGILYSDSFPVSDIVRGGKLDTFMEIMEKVIKKLPSDVKLIASHGRDYTIPDLKKHYEILQKTRKIILMNLDEGKTREQIAKEKTLESWKNWGKSLINLDGWIGTVDVHNKLKAIPAKKSICEPLTEVIVKEGVKNAIETYYRLKKEKGDIYDFAEFRLNLLGYNLMNRQMIKEAIEMFKLNVAEYPKAFNTYDSLGEAYLTAGNNELAIKNYKISLELNPKNINAKRVLNKLEKEK